MSLPTTSGAPGVGDLIQAAGTQALDSEEGVWVGGYLLKKVLGIGGMGATVYLGCSDSKTPPAAAIKVLPSEFLGDEGTTRRFERESGILKGIDHENIVEVFEVGTADDGSRYIIMENIEGGSLAKALAEQSKLSTRWSVGIVSSMCSALTELHSLDITHRDIKPGNILLADNGTAKLADFGLARYIDPTTLSNPLTQTGDTLGTVAYMAPEQLGATKKANARSDIYSLGVVLYQLLTGIMPVGHIRPLSEVRPELAHLDSVLMRAIEAEPERRFETAREFGDALVRAHEEGKPSLLTRRRVVGAVAAIGLSAAAIRLWPRPASQHPFWSGIDTAQRQFGQSDTTDVSIGVDGIAASFRLHRSTTPLSYRIEPMDVPDNWRTSLTLDDLAVARPVGESARLGLKRIEIQVPEAARGSNPAQLSLVNLPDIQIQLDEFTRFYQSCDLFNRLDARGVIDRNTEGLFLRSGLCEDFDEFCQIVGVGDMTATKVITGDAAESALIRVGVYQLLKVPEMSSHPAIVEDYDFQVSAWEARSRLEVAAAMIAEPWLLSQAESAMRPVYDAEKENQPAVQIAGDWFGLD